MYTRVLRITCVMYPRRGPYVVVPTYGYVRGVAGNCHPWPHRLKSVTQCAFKESQESRGRFSTMKSHKGVKVIKPDAVKVTLLFKDGVTKMIVCSVPSKFFALTPFVLVSTLKLSSECLSVVTLSAAVSRTVVTPISTLF